MLRVKVGGLIPSIMVCKEVQGGFSSKKRSGEDSSCGRYWVLEEKRQGPSYPRDHLRSVFAVGDLRESRIGSGIGSYGGERFLNLDQNCCITGPELLRASLSNTSARNSPQLGILKIWLLNPETKNHGSTVYSTCHQLKTQFLKNNFQSFDFTVGSTIENYCPLWIPSKFTDFQLIEGVQKTFTSRISYKWSTT